MRAKGKMEMRKMEERQAQTHIPSDRSHFLSLRGGSVFSGSSVVDEKFLFPHLRFLSLSICVHLCSSVVPTASLRGAVPPWPVWGLS